MEAGPFLKSIGVSGSAKVAVHVCEVEREVLIGLDHRLHVVTVVDAAMWMHRVLVASGWPHAPEAGERVHQVLLHLLPGCAWTTCPPVTLAAASWMLVLSSLRTPNAMQCVLFFYSLDEAEVTAALERYLLQ